MAEVWEVTGRGLTLTLNLLLSLSQTGHQFFLFTLFIEDIRHLLEGVDYVGTDLGQPRLLDQVIELPKDCVWGQRLDIFEKVLPFGLESLWLLQMRNRWSQKSQWTSKSRMLQSTPAARFLYGQGPGRVNAGQSGT